MVYLTLVNSQCPFGTSTPIEEIDRMLADPYAQSDFVYLDDPTGPDAPQLRIRRSAVVAYRQEA